MVVPDRTSTPLHAKLAETGHEFRWNRAPQPNVGDPNPHSIPIDRRMTMAPRRTLSSHLPIWILTLVLTAGVAVAAKAPAGAATGEDTDLGAAGAVKLRNAKAVGQGTKFSETIYGSLADGDLTRNDGILYDRYDVSIVSGAQVVITMQSYDFDSYLELYYEQAPEDWVLVARDDDGDGGLNARIDLTTENAGLYTIVTRSLEVGSRGSYLLAALVEDPLDEIQLSMEIAGELEIDNSVHGNITPDDPKNQENKHYDLYSFSGQEGEYVDFHLQSGNFDTMLAIFMGDLAAPEDFVMNDDIESGEDTNSRLSGKLPATGTYTLQVMSYFGFGPYTLTASSTPPQPIGPVAHDWSQLYPGGGDPDGRYALLVGIDDYPGSANDLDSCVADTQVMKNLLMRRFGFKASDIVVINDAEANREHILNAFTRHLGQAGRDGVAVFYYSGHGTQLDGNYGLAAEFDAEEDGRDEALAVWALDENNTFILDDELGMLADGLSAERVLVMLDSCHSGTGTRARGEKQIADFAGLKDTFTIPATFVGVGKDGAPSGSYKGGALKELVMRRQNHVLLTAAAADETALTGRDWPDYGGVASVFTYHLARAFDAAGAAATFADIGAVVRDQARAYTVAREDHVQTAQFEGDLLDMSIRAFLEPR